MNLLYRRIHRRERSQLTQIEITGTRNHVMIILQIRISRKVLTLYSRILTTEQELQITKTKETRRDPIFGFPKSRNVLKVKFYLESPEIRYLWGDVSDIFWKIGKNNKRQIGLICDQGGLKSRVYISSSPNSHKTYNSPEENI